MSELKERLAGLGLSQYHDAFVSEGFDTWETVLDITESDLSSLNVKLGHRRKLQRAIAEARGQSSDRPLPISLPKQSSGDGSYRSDDSAAEGKGRQGEPSTAGNRAGAGASGQKRKYRRHPKPDDNAPERPPSAYVIFSNQVRETLKGQEYTFTEIAKMVGEKWQELDAESREACESQANAAKEKYYAELAEYKKTEEYEAYQRYLEAFRAKHANPPKGAEGKRSKLEAEPSSNPPSRPPNPEPGEKAQNPRRVGSAQSDAYSGGPHPTESSPPAGPPRLPQGNSYPSHSPSPATHPYSGLNSPRLGDHSSMSASPRSATLHKESSFDMPPSSLSREASRSDSSLQQPSTAYAQSAFQPPPTTSPAVPYYPPQVELPSRRSYRELSRLPALTHEDTTISSDSGHTSATTNPPAPFPSTLPPLDATKSNRVLPQPIPSIAANAAPPDRAPPPTISPNQTQPPPDYRTSSSFAALVRAGELVSRGDAGDPMDVRGSP